MSKNEKYSQRKDGRYGTVVRTGKLLADGKPELIALYAYSSAELERLVARTKIYLEEGRFIKSSTTHLSDYARDWATSYKSIRSINTIAMYNNCIEKHIVPSIGHMQLANIKKSDIQKVINERKDHPRTCEIINLTLKQILDSAIEDCLIYKNPCTNISLPKKQKSKKRALNELELLAIKESDLYLKQRAFINVLFYFGVRREEALALTISDFDFSKNLLIINKVIVFDKNDPILENRTKSEAGTRTINIPNEVSSFFKDYIKSLPGFLLFPNNKGKIMSKSSYDKFWATIVKKLNEAVVTEKELLLDPNMKKIHITAHAFRHNYCTMLYYSGISLKKAAQLLGHSDIKMIMDIYAHLDDDKEQTQEKINKNIAL